MKTTWKDIAPVPTHQEFLDIVLSRTQRQLPTQIRAGFKISRIRGMIPILLILHQKVKYTQETFGEKFQHILDGFPRLQDIHPFHKDLMNTLYDADHFRIALGQVSTAKHLIETVSRDYVRLIKYAQSLFQCKQLKRAALGRMATITRRLKDPLVYLEQVRQHLGRLPSIDPNTRTLLICGYPNVGKSSFLRNITRADADVQPYAFTTKSLFVGHFDYKYLRFQAIDTPGILDHPLEEMNTIEMQSITAVAHLRSAILYFMDLSEQCGYSVGDQIKLFHSIKPLFANKIVFIVEQLQEILKAEDVEMLQASCTTTEGKLKSGSSAATPGSRLGDVLSRIHVAQPMGGLRETFIPEAVKDLKKYDKNDPNRRRLERDIEEENGGAGVYNFDMQRDYTLGNEEWNHDKIPEEEEEKLEADGYYESDESVEDAEDADNRLKADLIREKRVLMRNEAKMRKSLKNRAPSPAAPSRRLSEMSRGLDSAGYDNDAASSRARAANQLAAALLSALARAKSRARSTPATNRRLDGITTFSNRDKAERMAKLGQKKMNRMARAGEADRHTTASLEKHLFSGKRGMGKTDRR
ncbi:hypothetical protein PDIDSM_2451 [Penicillium digitatum]|nr:hypothetical protein PDIDSM_2451 [Penicillium digitatum]